MDSQTLHRLLKEQFIALTVILNTMLTNLLNLDILKLNEEKGENMLEKLFKYWKVGMIPVMSLFAFGYVLMIIQEQEFVFATVASLIIAPIFIGSVIMSSKKPSVRVQ